MSDPCTDKSHFSHYSILFIPTSPFFNKMIITLVGIKLIKHVIVLLPLAKLLSSQQVIYWYIPVVSILVATHCDVFLV